MKIELTFEKVTPKGYSVYKGEILTNNTVEVLKGKKWSNEVQTSKSTIKIYAMFKVDALRVTTEQVAKMRPMTKDNVAIPNFYWF